MKDLYLRTAIRPEAQKSSLKKSIMTICLAMIIISISELLLPLLEFEPLGIWAWLAGITTASFGVVMHQKLKMQEKNPNLLHGTEKNLSFYQANKKLFSLAWSQIDSFHFIDNGNDYGLAFKLKSPINSLSKKSRKEYGVDLFLPFFSHGSFLLLEKWRDLHVLEPKFDR